jgi:hypothetical protein
MVMGDLGSQIDALEAARLEETKRFNAEREILLARAPEKWEEMKEAFQRECDSVSKRSSRFTFHCYEDGPNVFCISNIIRGLSLRLVTLRFESRIPVIFFQIHGCQPKSGSVDLLVSGPNVFYANGRRGVVLPEFVLDVIMHVMKNN